MDPNLDKYIQQPNIPSQPVGGPQPNQPLMQTEQVPVQDPLQQQPQGPMQAPQVPAQPVTTQPLQQQSYNASQGEHQGGFKSFLKVFIVLIIIIGATAGIVYAGYVFMAPKQNSLAPNNANVFVEPTQAPVTPTPSGYQPNPNDTTDMSLDKDTEELNKNLDNFDSAMSGVDDSLVDKQTNLQ